MSQKALPSFSARFAVLVERRTGIRLSDTILQRLGDVLLARADTLAYANVDAYIADLDNPKLGTEMQTVVNLITVGKTSFARYPEIVRSIVDDVVPRLDNLLPSDTTLNLWSAGCSTGEELYTLTMALARQRWTERRKLNLLGTDINTRSLELARDGRFNVDPASLPDYVRRFGEPEGGGFIVAPDVRKLVRFEQLNLREGHYPEVAGGWHLVVCANVLIYFASETIHTVLGRILERMAPDSVLLLGPTESTGLSVAGCSLARIGETYLFVRGEWNGLLRRFLLTRQARPMPTVAKPTLASVSPPVGVSAVTHAFTQVTETAKAVAAASTSPPVERPAAGTPLPQAPATSFAAATTPAKGTPATAALLPATAAIEAALRLSTEERLARLEELRRSYPEEPRLLRALSMSYFNSHRFREAAQTLDEAIATDPLAFDLYFYQGWIRLALGEIEPAREALRRCLFLEPGLTFARYEFAMTLHEAGDFAAAVREYARAEGGATDPRVRARLRARAGDLGESFWVDDTFIVELCRKNRILAETGTEPLKAQRRRGFS
jgi:chemotaxis protein methyltransferase CheR